MIITAPAPDIRICSIETDPELLQLGEWLSARRDEVLGIDCETNGRDPFDPLFRLRMVQMSDGYVCFNVDVSKVDIRYLAHIIHRHRWWVAHYSENEVRFLAQGLPGSVRLDEDVPHIVDSQTVLAWYDPRTVTSQDEAYGKIPLEKGLKPTTHRVLGTTLLVDAEAARDRAAALMAPKGVRKQEEQRAHWFATVAFEDPLYQLYSGLDAVMVKRLWDLMTAAVRQRGQWQGLTLDLALQWHIDRSTFRGLMIDGPYARWLDGQLEQVITDRLPHLLEHGVAVSGMGGSVGAAFERMHVQSPKMTRAKEPKASWDKHVLADLAKWDGPVGALAKTIIEVRRASKFRSTYVKPMLDALTRDGWMRCSMRAVGTITSRQSAMRPPIQQLPKKDTRVRAAIRAPEGWVLVACDLSQGEPRTMAALSDDLNLLADILSGDLNSAVAAAVYGAQFDPTQAKVTGSPAYLMRQGAKAAFLAWCYGAQDPKLAETLAKDQAPGVAPTTAAPSVEWARRYPDLARYRNDMNSGRYVVLENGWVAPLWDRAFHKDDGTIGGQISWGYRHSRKGLNYATQGNQRQLLARAVHDLVAAGWSWALSMLVHDEILLCVPAWMAQAAKAALEAAMTMTFHGVPIECEATICGRTWTEQPEEFDMRELDFVEV